MRKFLAFSAVLAFVGVWIATRPSPAAPADAKPAAPDGPRYVIKPGVGIEGLEIGMSRKTVAGFLKVKDDGKEDAFSRVPYRGLDVGIADGQVSNITFVYFEHPRSDNAWPFDGVTDKGIGRVSTVHDVIRKYGEPDWERINKDSGNPCSFRSKPNTHLGYPDLGIMFSFRQEMGNLWYIRVSAPEKKEK